MNDFGGLWTENKIEMLVEYARAYLTIMNAHASTYEWKLLYFDGFAGSGLILKEKQGDKVVIGAAKRIVEIDAPRSFDEYYFVEKDPKNIVSLKKHTKEAFPEKTIHVAEEDCNEKLASMSRFLKSQKGKKYKVLAYIDPCGMQLKWESIELLRDSSVDVWILIPTGMGVNRLLKRDGNISESWVKKLEIFLGLSRAEILKHFYKTNQVLTLFGEETSLNKVDQAIQKSGELYIERLKKIFKFVSKAYVLKNSMNTILYHFIMVSNNKSAVDIANDIVGKYNKLS